MTKLLDAYDAYKTFERNAYFTVCYDAIPSLLKLKLSLKETAENMETILKLLDPDSQQLTPVFKGWNTSDYKHADPKEDFATEYLFQSETAQLLVWVDLDADGLSVEFLYHLADPAVEQWILATNQRLRDTLGRVKKKTFRVLSHNSQRFFTKEVSIENFETVDISRQYNDNFQEINVLIDQAIQETASGLILLYGEPGTGKTSYIKHLISKFSDKSFIFIQNDFVKDLLKPEFISFLLNHRESILVIEDAEKVVISRESSQQGSVVSTILQLTDGLFSDFLNIKIICTFNTDIKKVDKALLRKGRMIAKYEFGPLKADKADALLETLGQEAQHQDMTLADIFRFRSKDFEEKQEKKKIGFK